MESRGDGAASDAVVVAEVTRRVPPRHCDAQGVMHATRPAEYFEDAFLAWLDSACGGYAPVRAAAVDLVIVETTTRYRSPARLADEVMASATPIERSRRSIRVRFDLINGDGVVLVTAETTYVCVGSAGPVPLPPALANALAGVPARPPSVTQGVAR